MLWLKKIHEENYPLRRVISNVNTLTTFLEGNLNMILKDSLSRSNYAIKNSWDLQNIIVKR